MLYPVGLRRPGRALGKGGEMRDPVQNYMPHPVPIVIEQTKRGERAYDIYSRLLK